MIEKTTWITFDGRHIPIREMTHQHLSNCIWFHTLLSDKATQERALPHMRAEIERRFNAQLLPYAPHANFHEEIDRLRDLGYLQETGWYTTIWVNGKWIGEIITLKAIEKVLE